MSLHIEAKPDEIAETVLLPGDPLRAKHVAETMLENVTCYNEVRAMYGYTGVYNGKRVSVQGSGMGMPSTNIYAQELISDYGVKNLIRIGTCGGLQQHLNIGDVILATSASTDSGVNHRAFGGQDFAPTPDFDLLMAAHKKAEELGIRTFKGGILSTDTFYNNEPDRWDVWTKHGLLGVEMESSMLFTLASREGAKALTILSVSDNVLTGSAASAKDREQSFTDMAKIALEVA